MLVAMLSMVAIIVAFLLFTGIGPFDEMLERKRLNPRLFAKILMVLAVLGIVTRSFVIIDSDAAGHLKRVYLASDLPSGSIIAQKGEKGPQANILGPGFHFILFGKVLYQIEELPVIEIKEGNLGFVSAKDGLPLADKQYIADAWPQSKFKEMLDANYFLTEGRGQKGPQLTVLRPGKYRLNHYLYTVSQHRAVDVPTGKVAVVRSNVTEKEDCPDPLDISKGASGSNVSTPIVPQGCTGVWDKPLSPGRYYLNPKAYIPTIIPTRVQTWAYKGGYEQRQINLRVEENGTIKQIETSRRVEVPNTAADKAINVRVEGWTFPVELRVVAQVYPKDAPRVVASIGTIKDVEDRIVTPAIRDILRTIGGDSDRKVLDFIKKRGEIAAEVEKSIVTEAMKAGVTIQEVRLGEPAIPPELLVATLREQLAQQLKNTYREEQSAQAERIKVERDRASADQQHILVKAQIEKQAAEHRKTQLKLEGEGAKLKLIEIARGQSAQVAVLGKDRTMQLQMLKDVLAVAKETPEIIKIPTVQVIGDSTGLQGAAAILGSSNFVQMLKDTATATKAGSN